MKIKFKALIFCAIMIISTAMLTACTEEIMWVGNNYPGNMEGRYKYFNGTKYGDFNLKEGDTVSFTYDSKVEEGSLSIKITDPEAETIMELQPNKKGTEEMKAEKTGKYRVIITGGKTSGSYTVKWKIKK